MKPHQQEALLLVKHTGASYKIPDDTIGTKPFDCFRLKAPAFVVIMFYARGTNHFYMIDVDVWVQEQVISSRKSITEERASQIGKREEFA